MTTLIVDAPTPMPALACYDAALLATACGGAPLLRLLDPHGRRAPVTVSAAVWCGPPGPGDQGLLRRCHGATLDLGCGPGRLTAALAGRGVPVLGVDVSSEAIRQARGRGAPVRLACALTGDLGTGTWRHVLLADGNIGIGGDPVRLLARCRTLLAPGGDILVELSPPGASSWSGPVSLSHAGAVSAPFPWAEVCLDDIETVARAAGMAVAETWTEARRWFARVVAG